MKSIYISLFALLLSGSLFAQKDRDTRDTSLPANRANSQSNLRSEISLGTPQTIQNAKKNDSLSEIERKLFGYAIFHNPNSSFTPNLNMATPKSYVVGPGDLISVQVYGVAQNTYTLPVTNEGNVNIVDIGVVHLGGLTIESVKSLLERKLAIRYSGMNTSNPNTFIDVTLSNIRSIKVNMVGEVLTPGTYVLPSYVNIFNALFAAGGPTIKGTFRFIQVYRANKLVGEIDLYDYLVNGKASSNIRLEDNDVVLVRPSANRVEIIGEIRIPGFFEMKPNETFQDLLKYAGGFGGQAYKTLVKVKRSGAIENEVFDLSASQFANARLVDGDMITINPISGRFSNRIQVSGSVVNPGAYELIKGMTVPDLIQKAGGLKGDAFLQKALLYRTRPDFTQEVMMLDLSKKETSMLPLEKEDVLTISSLYDLKEEYYVQVSGEVNNGGIYPYTDSLTVAGLIFKAGGFKYSASGSYIEIVRRNISDPGKIAEVLNISINKDLGIQEGDQKISLRPFDHVFVRNSPGFQPVRLVNVEGEVLYSGAFAIDKKEMRVSDLLARAGGLTKYAYVKGATLLRRTKSFKATTLAENENAELQKLIVTLQSDPILASTESNKEYIKRINQKIAQNSLLAAKEQEAKNKDDQRKELVKEKTINNLSANTKAIEEKEQDLVAIDLEAILKTPGGTEDLVLKDGDILNVPEKLETVTVKGGVLYPVAVKYEQGVRFNEYINRAGGYDSRAIRKQAFVLQANGKVQRVKSFMFFRSFPKIEPGAEIIVPATITDKPPFNYASTVGLITGFVTSTLTLILVLKSL